MHIDECFSSGVGRIDRIALVYSRLGAQYYCRRRRDYGRAFDRHDILALVRARAVVSRVSEVRRYVIDPDAE